MKFNKFTDATIWVCQEWKKLPSKDATYLRKRFGFSNGAWKKAM